MTGRMVRIAAAQQACMTGDVTRNLASIKNVANQAVEHGVDVLVFPELFTCGYDAGEQFAGLAERKDGPVFAIISELCKRLDIAICYGYAERDGARTYNSAQLVDNQGKSLLNHRKTHLYGDYEKQWFSSGDEQGSSARYRGITFSALICYEIEFPELARAHAQNGVNVILVPTATSLKNNPEKVVHLLVRARAAENNLFVIYVNHAAGAGLMEFNGNSLIAGPYGVVYASSGLETDDFIFADVDTNHINEATKILPYLEDLRDDLYASPALAGKL
jgi:5-aminopentanamidase